MQQQKQVAAPHLHGALRQGSTLQRRCRRREKRLGTAAARGRRCRRTAAAAASLLAPTPLDVNRKSEARGSVLRQRVELGAGHAHLARNLACGDEAA